MRWLLLALVSLQAATCGQKGPLTLPDEPAAGGTVRGFAAADRSPLTSIRER